MDSALLTCVLRLVIVQVKYCVEKVTLPDLFRQSISVASWTKCGVLFNSVRVLLCSWHVPTLHSWSPVASAYMKYSANDFPDPVLSSAAHER